MIRTLMLAGLATIGLNACSNDKEQSGIALATSYFAPSEIVSPDRFSDLFSEPRSVLDIEFLDLGVAGKLILEQRDGPFARYLSADLGGIVLQRGFLHSIYGFGEPLIGADVSEPLRLVLAGHSGFADRFHTYVNGEDRAINRTYRCEVSAKGPSEVELEAGAVSTILMAEVCQSTAQSFENLYWVDLGRREVIQSRQWAGENTGYLVTRVTRP
ncbi:YjbF family lipoprotein [Loktanella sp. F6476L]|uniref:YjbF family lipoprotein n=1 Tax=Loktanella sp. F6476L TaxID=2926405 RepID=UPI001FF2D327|nr:YjbF family lipoprotein [Loktanella sp. F6476L]MCK0122414.1 YjbF family lipoprotein [Loktanella sp. F6476L]